MTQPAATSTTRPTLPISLYVADKTVILVGHDSTADERAERLAAAGARLRRIAGTEALTESLEGVFAVLAHTNDMELDKRIAERARAAGVLAYAHDQPDVSDFAMPALLRRGPLMIAISSNAAAPALSRRFREELGRLIESGGDALDKLIDTLVTRRAELPRGQRGELYAIASRLTIDGAIHIEE